MLADEFPGVCDSRVPRYGRVMKVSEDLTVEIWIVLEVDFPDRKGGG